MKKTRIKCPTLIIMAFLLFLLSGCNNTEPIQVSIPVTVETNQQTSDNLRTDFTFKVTIEPVEADFPMPPDEVMVFDDLEGEFYFGEIEFTQPGIFHYRIRQEAVAGFDEHDSLIELELDTHIFYIAITVEAEEGELTADVEMVNGEADVQFSNQTTYTFLGTWTAGFGNSINGFRQVREFEFEPERVFGLPGGSFRQGHEQGRVWEINENGNLLLEQQPGWETRDDVDLEINMEINGNQLILTDASGYTRHWWREGAQEGREEAPFIGVWDFGHGYRLNSNRDTGRTYQIEFLVDGSVAFRRGNVNIQDHRAYWEWDGNDQLKIEWHGWRRGLFTYTVEMSDNRLSMISTDGATGVWWRENTAFEPDQDWLIVDYLALFELDEKELITDNTVIFGEEFEFVIYDIESTVNSNDSGTYDWYFIVVVKRNGAVIDVIRHENTNEWITIYNLVTEYDLNFDGKNDVIFPPSFGRSHTVFLQHEDGLREVDEFPEGFFLHFDDERQLLMFNWFTGNGSHQQWQVWAFYQWVSNELVLVEELAFTQHYTQRRVWRERRLVDDHNGYWQEIELCILNNGFDGLWHDGGEICYGEYRGSWRGHHQDIEHWDGTYDSEFYQRLFGEDAYWDNRRNLRLFEG